VGKTSTAGIAHHRASSSFTPRVQRSQQALSAYYGMVAKVWRQNKIMGAATIAALPCCYARQQQHNRNSGEIRRLADGAPFGVRCWWATDVGGNGYSSVANGAANTGVPYQWRTMISVDVSPFIVVVMRQRKAECCSNASIADVLSGIY